MDIKIRKAESTLEDMKSIKGIDAATFEDCQYTLEEMLQLIDEGKQIVFLAESLGQTMGFVSLMEVYTLHYHGFWIDLIAVLPECQNRGIGEKLIRYAQAYAVQQGGAFVSALVRQSNQGSLKSFTKAGFKNEGAFNLFMK